MSKAKNDREVKATELKKTSNLFYWFTLVPAPDPAASFR